ncbi:MAG TPA: hypothetical protein PLQ76_02390 [bacterium]|nr:hypothetical protein [bacterium]
MDIGNIDMNVQTAVLAQTLKAEQYAVAVVMETIQRTQDMQKLVQEVMSAGAVVNTLA